MIILLLLPVQLNNVDTEDLIISVFVNMPEVGNSASKQVFKIQG